MSQPSSNSSADFNPVQLSLFVGAFDPSERDQSSQSDYATTVNNLSSSNPDLKLSGAEPQTATSTDSLCPLALEFMQAFEAVSGWEVQFKESASGGKMLRENKQAPQGKFEIIDMSIDWPAKTPTMHRGKCDQLVKVFSDLYDQARTTQGNLGKVQGLLAALTNSGEDDNQMIDSFVPTLENINADQSSDFTLCQDNEFDSDYEPAFVVKQEFDSSWLPEKSVWDGWSIAGASGIVGESYLDWSQEGDVLTVYVGQIESSLGAGDTESCLEVNAVSRQFKVCEDNTFAAFFFWDRRGGQLRSVEPGSWQTLYTEGAIVVSTDPAIQMPDSIVNARLGRCSLYGRATRSSDRIKDRCRPSSGRDQVRLALIRKDRCRCDGRQAGIINSDDNALPM